MPRLKAYQRAKAPRWLLIGLFMLAAVLSPSLGAIPARAGELADKTTPRNSASAVQLTLPRYGAVFGASTDQVATTAAKDIGAQLSLYFLSWNGVEPVNTDPDQYNYGGYDAGFTRSSSAGVQPVVSIVGCPTWACLTANGVINPGNMEDFAQFITTTVSRYSQAPYNVHYWELFNEPDAADANNHSIGYGGNATSYVAMLQTIVPKIKQIDPSAVVAMGGLAYDYFWEDGGPFNRNFLSEFLRAGGGQYTDYIGFHFYAFNVHWGADMAAKVAEIRNILAQYNYRGPLLCDELGQPSTLYTYTEQNQAQYLIQKYVQGFSVGLQSLFWYTIRDYGSAGDLFSVSGLLRIDSSRKPSFTAYQALVREVGNSDYLGGSAGIVAGAGTIQGGIFGGTTGNRVAVVWNSSAGVVPGTVISSDFVSAVDMFGAPISVSHDSQGNVQLPISNSPIYIRLSGSAPTPTAGTCVSGFSDVHSSDYFYDPVFYLACRNVISGYSDNTFRPFNNTTRGQLAKIVVLATGLPVITPATATFSDVPVGSAFFSVVETAAAKGIISGYNTVNGGREFRPNNNVTRGQLAKIIVGAKGWQLANPARPTFMDVPASNPFYQPIETAVAHGIISGYDVSGGKEFRVGANATRAQISKIIYFSFVSNSSLASAGPQPALKPGAPAGDNAGSGVATPSK